MEVLTNFVGGDLIADEAEEELEVEVPDPAMGELPGRVPPPSFVRASDAIGGTRGAAHARERQARGRIEEEPPGPGRRAHGGLFGRDVRCGVIGVNVSVPDLAACFPFAGWKDSFFGDLHATGRGGVEFYIGRKVGISRWPGARARRRGPGCGEYLVTREEQQER